MKKTFTILIAAIAAILMMAQPVKVMGQETPVYTLTPASGSNSSYTGSCSILINSISWNLTGNSQMQPWRLGGGKTLTFNNQDRALYSETAISNNIYKIEITQGADAYITVNSMTVTIHTSADDAASGANAIATFTPTYAANSTITITKQNTDSWAGKFYRVVYNLTKTNSKNAGYVSFSEAKFYEESSGGTDPTITFNNGSVNVGKTLDLSTLFTSNSSGAVTYSITEGGSYASLNGSTLTGVAEGSVTVKAEQAAAGNFNAGEATAAITVNPALTLSSIAITTPPTKTTYTEGEFFDATGMVVTATYSDATTDDVTASCTCTPNRPLTTSDTEITISYTENNVAKTTTQAITVNEVVDYATLPFEFDGGKADIENTIGLTQNGIDNSDYSSSPKLKFKTEGCYLILKINETPGELTFDIKGNGMSGSYEFSVMTSTDGITYETNTSYTSISGSTESKTINNLASDVRYIKWVYTTKYNGNVALGNIHLTKGVTVTFDGNGGTYNSASTYTQTVPSGGESYLDANKFTRDGFAFNGWNNESDGTGDKSYTDGESITITADLTLYAQWVQLYTATVADNIENGTVGIEDGSGISVSLSVPAGTEITLTNTPNSGYIFSEWNVYWMNGENPEPVTVTNNKFNMPAHNVTVSATFTTPPTQVNYAYSINGVLGDIQTADYGTDITLDEGEDLDKTFEFVGWTTDPNDVATASILAPGASYTVNATVEFFAVYGKQTVAPSTMTIDKTTENFPTTYGSNNTFTEYTLNGKRFKIQQAYYNSNVDTDALQFRANGHDNGTGTMYNNEDFGDITSIILNYTSKDNKKNFTIKVGTTANPTDGTEITPTHEDEGFEYTFDLGGNYTHFVLTNGTNAGYLNNIIINYSGVTTKYYTRVFVNETATASINIDGPSIIPAGSILNMGGNALTNNTAASLIIEDGGQLITTNSVTATVQKEIIGYGTGISDKWYFIASPITTDVSPANVTNLLGEQTSNNPVTYNYDLYRLSGITEGNHQVWENYRLHNTNQDPFMLLNSKGYLYAKQTNTTLSFAGTVKPYDADLNIPVTEGWNLIGNPYTFDAYANVAYYAMNAEGTGITANTVTTSTAVKPCTGIIIKAAGDGNVKFLDEAPVGSANNSNLQITLAHNVTSRDGASVNSTLDNAIVSFNEGTKLQKFYFGEPAANIYIPQNGEDYAIAFSNRQGDMPLNFKTTEAGMYTISFEGDNMDLKGVYLIDMLAEEKIDLSVDPSYTFIGSPADKAERFKIVFSPSTGSGADIFAYQSGSDIIVSGEGELQIFDVMGRKVKTQYISGVQTVNVNAQGVYIMKLNEKTQKIIVR